MIGQAHQNRGRVITFAALTVAIMLLFPIRPFGGAENADADWPYLDTVVHLDAVQIERLMDTMPEPVGDVAANYRSLSVHQVESSDNLYWIAATYGLSVQDLKELNDLDSDTIRVGQRLVVPFDRVRYYPAGVHLSTQEVEWLAQMIHAEARGEPYLGQVAVGAVIINRMLSTEFPNTLRGVLFQKNAFQPVQNRSFYRAPNESARRAALDALNGHDPTGGALFFFNPRQSTDRFMHNRPAKVTIGSHRFTI